MQGMLEVTKVAWHGGVTRPAQQLPLYQLQVMCNGAWMPTVAKGPCRWAAVCAQSPAPPPRPPSPGQRTCPGAAPPAGAARI